MRRADASEVAAGYFPPIIAIFIRLSRFWKNSPLRQLQTLMPRSLAIYPPVHSCMRRHIGSRPGPRAATLDRHCQRMNGNVPVLPGASGKGVAAATRRAKHLGVIRKRRVQSLSRKYLSFRKSEIVIESCRPVPQRGVSRSSRVAARDAMDAVAARRCAPRRTAKACGPGPPTLGSSPWAIFTGDGG